MAMGKNPYADIIVQGIGERGAVRTAFSGISMAPTLVDGMTIEVERIFAESVNPADIILYRKSEQIVVHRVIRILNEGGLRTFVTKGDNHAYIGSDRVPQDQLIGVVRAAFGKDDLRKDLLINNRLIAASYLTMGNLAEYAMRARQHVPRPVRLVLRHILGAFFLIFKKSIHTLYLGMRYGKLFIRRDSIRSVGV